MSSCRGEAPESAPLPSNATSPASGFLPSPSAFAEEFPSFDRYWYEGRAELNRFALQQNRYGDQHDGEAVLIFVTEPFLPTKQVKQEHGDKSDSISVLKVNAYRRFYTGIYPYTIMTSSFTPAASAGRPTLKLTNTVQEWCGQVFTQVNRRKGELQTVTYSYFQDEGDQRLTLPSTKLEDGLWAQIRIDPNAIAEGAQELVPGLDYLRLRHKAFRAYPAVVKRKKGASTDLVKGKVDSLEVSYAPLGRKLVIYYEPQFPHAIAAWEETVGPQRTTAVRTHAVMDDYWNHNGADDEEYREALGLAF